VAVVPERAASARFRIRAALSFSPLLMHRASRASIVCDWALSRPWTTLCICLAEGKGGLVSPSFALQFGDAEGDTIRLSSSSGDVELLVAAITPGQPESAIVLARAVYTRLWDDSLVTVGARGDARRIAPAEVAQAHSGRLGRRYRLRVLTSAGDDRSLSPGQVREAFSPAVRARIGDICSSFLSELATRLAACGCRAQAPVRNDEGRWSFTALVVFGIVMLEGVSIAPRWVLVLAVGLGLALSTFWVQVQFSGAVGVDARSSMFHGYSVIVGGAVTMLVCMIGALVPSMRAASTLSRSRVLRGE
jgi:hypothetical protein